MEDASRLHGPEFWHGDRWRRLAETVRAPATMLAVVLWTDKADAASGSLHPVVMSLGNIALNNGLTLAGMQTAGILPRVEIRMPHGTGQPERLSREQKRDKAQAAADALGLVVKEFEVNGSKGVGPGGGGGGGGAAPTPPHAPPHPPLSNLTRQ